MTSGAAEKQALSQDSVPAGGSDAVERLIREMTLEEKLAQLAGVWVNASTDGDSVAPLQNEMAGDGRSWDEVISNGLGQITRMYGTVPVEPLEGARRLAAAQEQIMAASRFGIPAQVHEECLAGLAAWKATAFPVPLAWGATFNPALVRRMAGLIGEQMRQLGVHQGLAPVLDVVRDLRWGRVEETIGEDPHLVAVGRFDAAGRARLAALQTLVESQLPADQQRLLKMARSRDTVLDGRKILIAEDDVRNVFALINVLEPLGATVEIARNGREALEKLRGDAGPDIDLVLMDIMMPEMDGFTAMREIRADNRIAKVPIIALTANAMPEDRVRCLEAGADDYIAKPIDIDRLVSLCRVWMPK